MAAKDDVTISVRLAFPRAGVQFVIEVRRPEGVADGQAPIFHLKVTDAGGARTVPLSVDASPQLADWARGYTRWLVRANVRASCDEKGIRGSFVEGLSPEQVLQGVRDACNMVRQRFELYQESILS